MDAGYLRIVVGLVFAGSIFLRAQADAAVVITMEQQGNNVVATGSGSIDLADLSVYNPDYVQSISEVEANIDRIFLNSGAVTTYLGSSGPANFGSGNESFAASSSGNAFGLSSTGIIAVPYGYNSGTPLSATATWDNTTLAALGVDGTYVWTWGTGGAADSLTLEIGPVTAVPEISTWAMMILGFAGIGFVSCSRKKLSAPCRR